MVLEIKASREDKEDNTGRIVYIIEPKPNKSTFCFGRGKVSDMRIDDISVSRLHTKIHFKEGKFILEDNKSKFGTTVLVKKRTPLLPGHVKAIQVGRTVINFKIITKN